MAAIVFGASDFRRAPPLTQRLWRASAQVWASGHDWTSSEYARWAVRGVNVPQSLGWLAACLHCNWALLDVLGNWWKLYKIVRFWVLGSSIKLAELQQVENYSSSQCCRKRLLPLQHEKSCREKILALAEVIRKGWRSWLQDLHLKTTDTTVWPRQVSHVSWLMLQRPGLCWAVRWNAKPIVGKSSWTCSGVAHLCQTHTHTYTSGTSAI